MWLIALFVALVAADPPLALKMVPGPPSQVEIRNTGTQPVNAWAFAISAPNPGGGIRRTFHSADVYLSEVTAGLQGAAPHLTILQPGASRLVPVDPFPPGASVQVIAVVFEDNTASGDDQTITEIFRKRAVERDQIKQVVDIFNASLLPEKGVAALQDLRRRFAETTDATESEAHRSARMAVESWLQQAGTHGDLVDESVRTYVAFVSRQYLAAAQRAARQQ
jgi:hypothetical protein